MMVGTLFNSSSTVLMLKTKVDFISIQNLLGKATTTRRSLICNGGQVHESDSSPTLKQSNDKVLQSRAPDSLCAHRFCSCGRRHLMEAIGTSFFAIPSSSASPPPLDDPEDVLNSIHPPRPDWYEELYAFILDKGSKAYEAEVAGFKSQIFTNLRGKAKIVLELGIGTGPNLKYYASDNGVHVFGIDPNRKMEKYAQAAAATAGLPPENFKFIHAVAEALPLSDASVDVVVGTLVLCSVKDINMTLKEVMRVLKPGGLFLFVEHVAAKDGTILRFVQGILDPLQQRVSDGCHLTRKTGEYISEAGFSDVDINMAFVSVASILGPHIYGIACK
ncbi:Methyltransferase-like protein 7A [Camellia lanceoleosa]|uniref:Methyltransferase-like protein 7A n=1 Tax=Camellia lanceoleosa TaxID=1840588 RepID=A0ACC0IBW8_9ERIC|nr:Methyltransferase-like protein 7A [Camellia lanceoleosa]